MILRYKMDAISSNLTHRSKEADRKQDGIKDFQTRNQESEIVGTCEEERGVVIAQNVLSTGCRIQRDNHGLLLPKCKNN